MPVLMIWSPVESVGDYLHVQYQEQHKNPPALLHGSVNKDWTTDCIPAEPGDEKQIEKKMSLDFAII